MTDTTLSDLQSPAQWLENRTLFDPPFFQAVWTPSAACSKQASGRENRSVLVECQEAKINSFGKTFNGGDNLVDAWPDAVDGGYAAGVLPELVTVGNVCGGTNLVLQ